MLMLRIMLNYEIQKDKPLFKPVVKMKFNIRNERKIDLN